MIPVSNNATRSNYAQRDDPPSATLSSTGRLTFNHKAAAIFRSFGIDKLYLSYEPSKVPSNEQVISLSDTGEPGIIPYQLTFGHTLHIKSFLNLFSREAFYYTGKYNVELYIAKEEDTERVKSSVIVKLTKVKGIILGGDSAEK